jgi:predicted HTH domain antitoxin
MPLNGELHFMTHRLTIEYSENLPDALHESAENFEREAKMAMAVKLYEMKRISSGIAAELAGIDRVSFLLQLRRYDVPMLDTEPSELLSDIANA